MEDLHDIPECLRRRAIEVLQPGESIHLQTQPNPKTYRLSHGFERWMLGLLVLPLGALLFGAGLSSLATGDVNARVWLLPWPPTMFAWWFVCELWARGARARNLLYVITDQRVLLLLRRERNDTLWLGPARLPGSRRSRSAEADGSIVEVYEISEIDGVEAKSSGDGSTTLSLFHPALAEGNVPPTKLQSVRDASRAKVGVLAAVPWR